MLITVNDRMSYKITRREYTDEGFLRVPGRVARTGVQDYLASELGITDRKPNDIVRIYRPDEEVFDNASLESYAGADVTIEHPKQMVDAETYKSTTVGVVRGIASRDGDFVNADLIIKDKSAIETVESGKVQLSAGYTAEYDMTPGVTPTGDSYDGIQRSIKINHVAIVGRARAGAQARLFDHKGATAMKKITLDSGREVEVEDNATAILISDTIERLNNEVATRDTVITSLNDEVTGLKTASNDAAITAKVGEVLKAMDGARRIAGKEFTCDSVDVREIQVAALKVVNKDADYTGKDASYIAGIFDATPDMKEDEDDEDTDDAGGRVVPPRKGAKDSYKGLTQDADPSKDEKSRVSAYDSHKDSLSNAWKGEK